MVGQGKILEMGSYAELAAAGGAFTNVMKIQMMGQEGEAAASAAAGEALPEAGERAELARLSPGVQGDIKVVDGPADGKVSLALIWTMLLQASRMPAFYFNNSKAQSCAACCCWDQQCCVCCGIILDSQQHLQTAPCVASSEGPGFVACCTTAGPGGH